MPRRAASHGRWCVGGRWFVVDKAGMSLSKPLLETTKADWDLQHDVMSKSSSLVSRAAVRGLIDQKLAATSSTSRRNEPGPPGQQLGRENRQLTGVCGAPMPLRTHPVRRAPHIGDLVAALTAV